MGTTNKNIFLRLRTRSLIRRLFFYFLSRYPELQLYLYAVNLELVISLYVCSMTIRRMTQIQDFSFWESVCLTAITHTYAAMVFFQVHPWWAMRRKCTRISTYSERGCSQNRNLTGTIYYWSVILRRFSVVLNSAKRDANGFFKVLLLSSHLLISRHPFQKSKFGTCAVTGYCSFNWLQYVFQGRNWLRSRYENATPYLCWVFCALLGDLCN